MVLTDAKRKTNMDYDRKNTKLIGTKLNRNTDADILSHLEKQDNIQGYLKRLVREDMNSKKGGKTMKKFGWHIIHRFEGNPDWQELNRLIQFDSGVEEPYCETEDDYKQAVKEGWIKFDGKETTVWADGEYET